MVKHKRRGKPKIEQPQHTKAEEEAYERAKQADAESASSEELEAAAEILHQVGEAAEAEDVLSTEEREEHDKAVLEDIMDRHGVDGVASMLRDICRLKAEHLRSNRQDETSAVIWEQYAEELDSFVGWYYGLGD